ncbi:MAG: V-type ATP synthase subunit D [Candidatus Methanomethylicia archaeon]|nr:V-type ATP synthase subunit D [Candidatus Methanomethylicia archaeon]MCQ5340359.1 V-type ATP synthase subunit D [Candidatus Methanomethylicia archaeon]
MSLRVIPSKMNLIRFRRTLNFLIRVHDLLEDKKEILLLEISKRINETIKLRKEVNEMLKNAYELLNKANVIMGNKKIEMIEPISEYKIEIKKRKIMGISIPAISFSKEKKPISYGISQPTVLLDNFIEIFDKCIPMLLKLAEMEMILIKLLEEVKNTQKRINALEYVLIPRYKSLIAFISSVLEESEREEFVRIKKLKNIWMRRAVHE